MLWWHSLSAFSLHELYENCLAFTVLKLSVCKVALRAHVTDEETGDRENSIFVSGSSYGTDYHKLGDLK